jgi:putative effector of murein hydrolase
MITVLVILAAIYGLYLTYVKYTDALKITNQRSMKAAERKTDAIVLAVATVALTLAVLTMTTFDTDFHAFYERTAFIWNLIGVAFIAGGWYLLYKCIGENFKGYGNFWLGVGFFVLVVLGAGIACGFNFDYFGSGK